MKKLFLLIIGLIALSLIIGIIASSGIYSYYSFTPENEVWNNFVTARRISFAVSIIGLIVAYFFKSKKEN